MAISDIEYALLSALVNTRLDNLNEDSLKLGSGDLGNDIRNLIASPDDTEWGVAGFKPQEITLKKIQDAAANPALTPGDLVASGMMAATFLRGNEAVIAFRGTEEKTDDRATDITLSKLAGFGMPHQVKAAYYYVQAAIATLPPGTKITFTGHSLGGGLASIMASDLNNAAAVNDNLPLHLLDQISKR